MNVTNLNENGSVHRLALLALAAFALAACGQQRDSTAESLAQTDDQAQVDQAAVDLDRAVIEGGNLPSKTLALVKAIRTARDEGVSDDWIDNEIDKAEEVIVDVCDSCYSMLEDVR